MFLEPEGSSREEIEIKKSRFISYAKKVVSRNEVMEYVSELREKYADARHVCWGYVIGDPNNSTNSGCNDDGEPSGTAGKPILSQINYSNIGNVVVVSVRYFGGIRLGAGGLVRAYRESAQKALLALRTLEHIAISEITIICPFDEESQIRRIIDSLSGKIYDISYSVEVEMMVKLPESSVTQLQDSLITLSARLSDNS
jgi:uncharacterized YigZ family protein